MVKSAPNLGRIALKVPGPVGAPFEILADAMARHIGNQAAGFVRRVFALHDDPFFRQALGAEFVDYYVHIKNAEIERFQAEVSDWEHREYFEMF